MKQIIVLLFLFLGTMSVKALETTQLVLQTKEGTKVSYLLRTIPYVKFEDGNIQVQSNGISVYYAIPQTAKFYYEKVEDIEMGIRDLQTDQPVYSFDGNAIVFPSLKPQSVISLYTMNGVVLFSKSNLSEGEYMLSLDNLATGVYLVNVNEITCKIIKQ